MTGGDWTREQVAACVNNAFHVERKPFVNLDMEHSSHWNIQNVIRWANEMGYYAEELPASESIKVWRDKSPVRD